MTDDQKVDVPHEGENPFDEEKGDDTSSGSTTENNEDDTQTDRGDDENTDQAGDGTDDDASAGGEAGKGTKTDKDVPFHEHPRWKQRESEWQQKFNEQEQRHQNDIKAIREEFGAARKENAEATEIPSWFGGDQKQWDQFREWNDKQISSAEERALKKLGETRKAEDDAVKEATEYMRTELSFIESDDELNPEHKKVDPNKLLKFVMDNDLVDSKGRWNYRAGWRMMKGSASTTKPPAKPNTTDRKVLAGATTTQPQKGETKPKAFKTSEDFKQSRPW